MSTIVTHLKTEWMPVMIKEDQSAVYDIQAQIPMESNLYITNEYLMTDC